VGRARQRAAADGGDLRSRFTRPRATSARSLSGELNNLATAYLPGRLAGRARLPEPDTFDEVGVYGPAGEYVTYLIAGTISASVLEQSAVTLTTTGSYP
jgi:hypothetical protein